MVRIHKLRTMGEVVIVVVVSILYLMRFSKYKLLSTVIKDNTYVVRTCTTVTVIPFKSNETYIANSFGIKKTCTYISRYQ